MNFEKHYGKAGWFVAGVTAGGLARSTKNYWITGLPIAFKFPSYKSMLPPAGLGEEIDEMHTRAMMENFAEIGAYGIGVATSHADILISKAIEYAPMIKRGIEQIL